MYTAAIKTYDCWVSKDYHDTTQYLNLSQDTHGQQEISNLFFMIFHVSISLNYQAESKQSAAWNALFSVAGDFIVVRLHHLVEVRLSSSAQINLAVRLKIKSKLHSKADYTTIWRGFVSDTASKDLKQIA